MADAGSLAKQPIIRGYQSVGAIEAVFWPTDKIPGMRILGTQSTEAPDFLTKKDISDGYLLAGFRLDATLAAAAQQISTSNVTPLLGGGGLAIINNNKTGTLPIAATRVDSIIATSAIAKEYGFNTSPYDKSPFGFIRSSGQSDGDTTVTARAAYDIINVAQMIQRYSAAINIRFRFLFSGVITDIWFYTCTVANVSPFIIAGNDVPDYNVALNYLDWDVAYSN